MSKFSNRSSNWQNAADLSDLVSSGRDRKPEELAFAEECELKSLVFRVERFGLCHCIFFFLAVCFFCLLQAFTSLFSCECISWL